jgi:hypothetical protein
MNASIHKNGKCFFFANKKCFVEVIQCSGEEMNLVLMGIYPSTLGGLNNSNTNNNFPSKQQQHQPMSPLNSFIFNQPMAPPLIGPMGMQMPPPPPSLQFPAQTLPSSSLSLQQPQNIGFPYSHQQTVNLSHLRPIHQMNTPPILQSSLLQSSQFPSLLNHHQHHQSYPPQPPHSLVYWFPATPPISPSNSTTTGAMAPNTSASIFQMQSSASTAMPHQVPWVLILKGAPGTLKKADVLHFFSGFDVLSEYVQINAYNEPFLADAFVTFSSRSEAERALISKNFQKIGNNTVELFLAV